MYILYIKDFIQKLEAHLNMKRSPGHSYIVESRYFKIGLLENLVKL